MFTDRFVKVPILVYDRQLKDMTGKAKDERSEMYIIPTQIESFRISYNEDPDDPESVAVIMKSGDAFLCPTSIENFKKILNSFE